MRDMEICHFWVGQFPEEMASEYFAEVWNEDDEDREHTPLSAFANDQGVKWYDHDFLEYGWGSAESVEALIAGYSYSEQWGGELARRCDAAGLAGINFFVFITASEIEIPKSVQVEKYWLRYMGTIEYRI